MSIPIDAKEREFIKKFRNRVTDVVPHEKLENDHFLIRWLRARDYDLDKAETMLRKSISWNKRNETETILSWKPVNNYYRYAVVGHDTEGCPVFILPVGCWALREAVENGDIVPAFRSVLRILTRMELELALASKNFKKPVNQIILIFDFQQFSHRQLSNRTVVQGLVEFFRIFEANYPEILKSCMFINTARMFQLFFAIVKPFLSGRTMNKMEFSGMQKKKWLPSLQAKVPLDILPPCYGGTRAGVDEYCSTSSIWNDDEPLQKNFYGTDSENSDCQIISEQDDNSSNDGFKREEIPAGSKLNLDYPVSLDSRDARYLLRWHIKSEGYDVGFQVTFKPEGYDMSRDVVTYRRLDSHVTPVEGSLVCDEAGTYTITLDNSYSLRRQKTVLHKVSLLELND